ncbi:MAG: radical SAM protein [Planctomycetes bacterium]|nr:radical SAM protein [Planctomycetota bacterium]
MLKAVHFLLTYACNFECDHCFVYSRPGAKGTFTIGMIRSVLDDLAEIQGVDTVYFEGGEPALYYATMLEGIRMARSKGFRAGIVTNAYWAISEEDAEAWLQPLADLGLMKMSVSDDDLHYGAGEDTPPKRAIRAAATLGIDTGVLSTQRPHVTDGDGTRATTTAGGVMFRGRAVEKLTGGLPLKDWRQFDECPHEDLRNPQRVHLDAYGHMHLCQGLSMGCILEKPLREIVEKYDAASHPIAGVLAEGGPAGLAEEFGHACSEGYVDACHLCYEVRKTLVDKYPEHLCPRQVYGLAPPAPTG